MDHILYIYIYDFKCLHDIELVVDTRYNFNFDRENMQISITKNKLPENFWGSGIISLTSIFGNNGAGKSTAIEFILNAIVSASGSDPVNGIVLYENNGDLYVYNHSVDKEYKSLKIEGNDLFENPPMEDAELPDINTFFYTGHYTPEYNYAKLQTIQLSGFHNASDGCLLRTDLEKFANTTDPYLNLSLGSYLNCHITENNFRICRLLINERLRKAFPKFKYPQYILLAPNSGGYDCLRFNPIINGEIIPDVKEFMELPKTMVFKDSRNQVLSKFIHYNILNAISEKHLLGPKSPMLKRWYGFFNPLKDVMPQFQEFINYQEIHEQQILNPIYNVLSKISTETLFNDKTGVFYIDAYKKSNSLEKFLEDVFRSRFFLTSRFFDTYYSHNREALYNTVSSGEQKMLDLFSRMYYAIELSPQKYDNLLSPTLLILDEAEIGLHPEWQRSYLKTLLDFLHSLYVVAGLKFQIILTSHSPILLSDIPVGCCNFLKKDYESDRTTNERKNHDETFASNVFDLYRDSFFLSEGLIGRFAEDKLNNLKLKIERGDDDVYDEIALIGDHHLREYFMHLLPKEKLDRDGREDAIRFYRKKIRELEEGGL